MMINGTWMVINIEDNIPHSNDGKCLMEKRQAYQKLGTELHNKYRDLSKNCSNNTYYVMNLKICY